MYGCIADSLKGDLKRHSTITDIFYQSSILNYVVSTADSLRLQEMKSHFTLLFRYTCESHEKYIGKFLVTDKSSSPPLRCISFSINRIEYNNVTECHTKQTTIWFDLIWRYFEWFFKINWVQTHQIIVTLWYSRGTSIE